MWFLLIFLLLVPGQFKTYGQFNPGARQISMSNSDVGLSNDVFAIFNNPAGLAQMNWRELGIFYSPSPFGLTELANGFIAYHEPFDFSSVGFGATTFGFELYREIKITTVYSYNYINRFFAGAALNYYTVSIKNYGNDNTFYLTLGGLYYLQDDLRIGFSLQNVNRATVGTDKDNIPFVFNMGISYDILSELNINLGLEKELKHDYSLCGGIEYQLSDLIYLRSGFSNEPSRYTAGVGISYSLFSLDYAFFTHTDLGLTHQAGLIISFGAEGNRNNKIRNHLKIH